MNEPDTLIQKTEWNIKPAPTRRLCSGPELQSGGSKARCEYIQDAYEYWHLRPQPAVAPSHMWPHSLNNVASEIIQSKEEDAGDEFQL